MVNAVMLYAEPPPQLHQQVARRGFRHHPSPNYSALPHLPAEIRQLLPAGDAHVIVRHFNGQSGEKGAGYNDRFGQGRLLKLVAHEASQ